MGTRHFDTTLEIGDDEIEVSVEYTFNPGFPGTNFSGPTDGAMPPERREVWEITSVRAAGEEMRSKLTAKELEDLLERASSDMEVQDERDAERSFHDDCS
jgi:hypothetical protein